MNRMMEIAQELRALAQTGLCYDTDDYQRERYNAILTLSDEMLHIASGWPVEEIAHAFTLMKEYATPKVDVRGVVFNDRRELLLTQEKCDGCWSLPGGWGDVGLTPSENVVREMWEEAGLRVAPVRLLMMVDYRRWNTPPTNLSIYKLFLLCRADEADVRDYHSHEAFDILGSGFFAQDRIPPLSTSRTSAAQVAALFDFYDHPERPAIID